MIKATFKKNELGQFVSMEVTGHAMAGEYGSDIVCAGVSSLVISMVNNIERLAKITPIIDVDEVEGGYLYIELPNDVTIQQQKTAQLLFESCYLALSQDIIQNYSEYIEIKLINKR